MTFAQICSRYENHSPSTTQGNGTSSTSERDERNGTDKAADLNIKNEVSWKLSCELQRINYPMNFSFAGRRRRFTNENGNETVTVAACIIRSAHANDTCGAIW